jgi:hypothetical protein
MTIITNSFPAFSGCTTIVHRPADIAGLREATDDSSGVVVRAFPFAELTSVVAARLLWCPGAYILGGESHAYIGEAVVLGRRLPAHMTDPAKGFASEVFVITTVDPLRLDKSSVLYLQKRLTEQAEAAGLVTVLKGAAPPSVDLPAYRVATLDRILRDGYRLLFDAGCRAFHSIEPARPAAPETDPALAVAGEAEDRGLLRIGVSIPSDAPAYELFYTGTRARGHELQDGFFVVAAGSDIRVEINESVNPIVRTRRARLHDRNALMPIAGVTDRMRLADHVEFPSAAIAAKVVCGAHVNSGQWHPVPDAPT